MWPWVDLQPPAAPYLPPSPRPRPPAPWLGLSTSSSADPAMAACLWLCLPVAGVDVLGAGHCPGHSLRDLLEQFHAALLVGPAPLTVLKTWISVEGGPKRKKNMVQCARHVYYLNWDRSEREGRGCGWSLWGTRWAREHAVPPCGPTSVPFPPRFPERSGKGPAGRGAALPHPRALGGPRST